MKLDLALYKHLNAFTFAGEFAVEGDRIGIFGPSGSGKSTLSRLLTGELCADHGHIRLGERTLFDSMRRINLKPERRRVAVVFQHACLFPHFNVRNNLLYGYRRTAPDERRLTLEEVTDALAIGNLLERGVAQLSGGEKQRVALGRALLACPELLILDEPLSALDKRLKEQIIPFLRKVLRRFSIPYLYISHSLSEMRLLTDRVLQFSSGRLQQLTDAETLARRRMSSNRHGYLNHLHLSDPREVGNLLGYRWGDNELLLTDRQPVGSGLFELSSKDILLFRNHPQAISARNLLIGSITELLPQGGFVGVELNCGGQKLLVQVVREVVPELDLQVGKKVYAAVKASAFRRLI